MSEIVALNDDKSDLLLTYLENTMHDIKTPISIIQAMILNMENLCDSLEITAELKKYIETSKKYCTKIIELLNDANDFNKILCERFSPLLKDCDIVELTRESVNATTVMSERKNITVSFESNIEAKTIPIDEKLYGRIMLNLLSNAVKFTAMNGCVKVFLNDCIDCITIDVIDNGKGFTDEELASLFTRYQTNRSETNRTGSGIGLTITKEMVEILGGEIRANCNLNGIGAHLSFFIPVNPLCNDGDEQF